MQDLKNSLLLLICLVYKGTFHSSFILGTENVIEAKTNTLDNL